MLEFTTEKGTTLYYDVTYELGGYNHFTGGTTPRAYMLSIKRQRNVFSAFSGLDSSSGAVRMVLLEVGRRSKKQEANAYSMVTDELLQDIANKYGI